MCSQRPTNVALQRSQAKGQLLPQSRLGRRFALSGRLQVSLVLPRARLEISYHYQRGSSFELTISCETCAIALLGTKSQS